MQQQSFHIQTGSEGCQQITPQKYHSAMKFFLVSQCRKEMHNVSDFDLWNRLVSS